MTDMEWTVLTSNVLPWGADVPSWWPEEVPLACGLPGSPARYIVPEVVVTALNTYGSSPDRVQAALRRCAREGIPALQGLKTLGGDRVLRDTLRLWLREDFPSQPRPARP